MLTLVTSGSAYAFVTGNLDPNFNSVFATSSSDAGKDGSSSGSNNDGSSSDNNKKSESSSEGGGSSSDNGGSSGSSVGEAISSDSSSSTAVQQGTSDSSSTSTSPPAPEENTAPPQDTGLQAPAPAGMCPDGSPPDANGNCPSSPGSNIATMPPPSLGERFFHSRSSQIPGVIPAPSVDTPIPKDTGIGQPIQTDKTDNLLGPRSSQLQRTPDSVLTQKPESNIGDLLGSSSSQLQTELPKTTTTQNAPDTLFKGPKSVPGSVPLGNPALVPAPIEEGGQSPDDPCIVDQCNFPYPTSHDEICRNGIDDDFDGKVDEAYPCREVPGQSQPRPSDGILTPTPGQPLGP